MENVYKKFNDAIRENKGYEFIATNYWRMSADELADICKELVYVIETMQDGVDYSKEALVSKLTNEIEFNYFD